MRGRGQQSRIALSVRETKSTPRFLRRLRVSIRSLSERRGECRRFLEAEAEAGNTSAVIILDHRQPGLGGFAILIEQPDVKRAMIRLPHGIGVGGLSPVDQIKFLPIGSRSLVGKSDECRIKTFDDLIVQKSPAKSWDLQDDGRRSWEGQCRWRDSNPQPLAGTCF